MQTTFGDNDRLAAIVTNLIRAPLLVLLSDVDGLYDGDPSQPGSRVIPTVERLDRRSTTWCGTEPGGAARGAWPASSRPPGWPPRAGENVIIAGGRTPNVLSRILAGEPVGTLFLAQGQTVAARKRWIGFTVKPRGRLVLDAGAREAVQRKGRSLLAIGIVDVEGKFHKGDVVALRGPDGAEFARGLTNYGHEDLAKIKGLRTNQIAEALGHCPYEEVIHRDNMVVTADSP